MDEEFEWWGDDPDDEVFATEGDLTPVPYRCAACGETNTTMLDLGGGLRQQYTEDCAVCCRPNLLTITIEADTLLVSLHNELEYDC